MQKDYTLKAEVFGLDKEGNKVILSGEIIKIKRAWEEGISTIIIKPENSEGDVQITVGGKYALYEDVRMDKILIDEV